MKDPIKELRDLATSMGDKAASMSEHGFSPAALRIESICDEIEQYYMKLPVDADGVPIRVGDEIEYPNGRRDVVRFITINDNSPTFNESGWIASKCRHVKPNTIESLLEEFVTKASKDTIEANGRTYWRENMELLSEYAERIRKAVVE